MFGIGALVAIRNKIPKIPLISASIILTPTFSSTTGNVFLFALSSDLIRTMTAETAVTFLKNEDLHSLRRVVCVDLSPGDSDLLSGSQKQHQ